MWRLHSKATCLFLASIKDCATCAKLSNDGFIVGSTSPGRRRAAVELSSIPYNRFSEGVLANVEFSAPIFGGA
jgi:hypothetical protein